MFWTAFIPKVLVFFFSLDSVLVYNVYYLSKPILKPCGTARFQTDSSLYTTG